MHFLTFLTNSYLILTLLFLISVISSRVAADRLINHDTSEMREEVEENRWIFNDDVEIVIAHVTESQGRGHFNLLIIISQLHFHLTSLHHIIVHKRWCESHQKERFDSGYIEIYELKK